MKYNPLDPLPKDQVPWLLFRVEHSQSTHFADLPQSQRCKDPGKPTALELDLHLSSNSTNTPSTPETPSIPATPPPTPTMPTTPSTTTALPTEPGIIHSFYSTWSNALHHLTHLEKTGKQNTSIIALWAKNMPNVYDGERLALAFRYDDAGTDSRRRLSGHRDEFLVYGGVLTGQSQSQSQSQGNGGGNRVLAVFPGSSTTTTAIAPPTPGGTSDGKSARKVTFECPYYYTVTGTLPSGYFPGKKGSDRTLQDLEEEIYARTGVHDEFWRDQLVRAICNVPYVFPVEYQPWLADGFGGGL